MLKPANKLPNRLWKLIDLAVADMKDLLKTKKYVANMSIFHTPRDGKCCICLAGAIIAGELAPNMADRHISYADFGDNIEGKLLALDDFRFGWVARAVESFYKPSMETDKKASRAVNVLCRGTENTPWRIEGEPSASELRKFYTAITKAARKLEAIDI